MFHTLAVAISKDLSPHWQVSSMLSEKKLIRRAKHSMVDEFPPSHINSEGQSDVVSCFWLLWPGRRSDEGQNHTILHGDTVLVTMFWWNPSKHGWDDKALNLKFDKVILTEEVGRNICCQMQSNYWHYVLLVWSVAQKTQW